MSPRIFTSRDYEKYLTDNYVRLSSCHKPSHTLNTFVRPTGTGGTTLGDLRREPLAEMILGTIASLFRRSGTLPPGIIRPKRHSPTTCTYSASFHNCTCSPCMQLSREVPSRPRGRSLQVFPPLPPQKVYSACFGGSTQHLLGMQTLFLRFLFGILSGPTHPIHDSINGTSSAFRHQLSP